MSTMSTSENPAVSRFRQYLRCKSMHPNPDYSACVDFLKTQATELGLDCKVLEIIPANPIVIMTWKGKDPTLSALLLNSHMDVVPVFPEKWTYDPFAAHKDDKGNIYARGAQDMKCVGSQYLEAIRELKLNYNKSFLRTIHLSFVPDEEVGGGKGMVALLNNDEFKKMNIGFALDEGLASPDDSFSVYYGQRTAWWTEVSCKGQPGHGSTLGENTSGEKFRRVIDSFMDFRATQVKLLKEGADLGEVTSVNLTLCSGGPQFNVIPSEMKAGFDIRIPPTVDLNKFEAKLLSWCKAAGDDVTIRFVQKGESQATTSTSEDDPWWKALSSALVDEMKARIVKRIFQGGIDSRYLRAIGIPAIGFSPMNHTPILLHDNDEFLNEKVFLKGIEYYLKIIPNLANVAKFN